jgi:formamidopyrimidine-DNA glycosylase
MPELPEVETIRRSLAPRIVGQRIARVVVRERRLRVPIAADFESRLAGRRVEDVERRGQYLLLRLEGRAVLLVHLGMSGRLWVRASDVASELHDHVEIGFERGFVVVFNDPRRFGLMRVGDGDAFDELRTVGVDPLGHGWSEEDWRQRLRNRRLPIKNLLMDQRVLAGIGNIYANEMLHRAGIRPRRSASRLKRQEIERLSVAMREVLEAAVRLGGSSISDYRDAEGREGYFQSHHAVYDRAGQPCPGCGTAIRRIVLSGRSSFYCPKCQR